MEILLKSPLLVADGAHNVYSVESLLKSLPKYLNYEKLIIVAGFSKDKSVVGMAQALEENADVIFATASRHPRSLTPCEVAGLFTKSVTTVDRAADALRLAQAPRGSPAYGDRLLPTPKTPKLIYNFFINRIQKTYRVLVALLLRSL